MTETPQEWAAWLKQKAHGGNDVQLSADGAEVLAGLLLTLAADAESEAEFDAKFDAALAATFPPLATHPAAIAARRAVPAPPPSGWLNVDALSERECLEIRGALLKPRGPSDAFEAGFVRGVLKGGEKNTR